MNRHLRGKLDEAMTAQQVIMDRLTAMHNGREVITIRGLRHLLVQTCDAAAAIKAVFTAFRKRS